MKYGEDQFKRREMLYKQVGLYGTVCECGYRLPHDPTRLQEQVVAHIDTCFGLTHPALSGPL